MPVNRELWREPFYIDQGARLALSKLRHRPAGTT